jgi:hypothetical protein
MEARELYQSRRRDITALLDLIGQEVAHHAQYAEKEGLHYGHTGDLQPVRERLVEALAQIAQRSEADVEAMLDDVAAGREQAAARENENTTNN